MSAREIRAHLCEVRAAPEAGQVRFAGYAARFNTWSQNLGGFREKILPGAFAEAVQTDDVRCLLNHNPDHVLGRNRAGTLRLTEDEQGLYFEVTAPDTGWARDLRVSVERGDINQCSFQFYAMDEEWNWAMPGSGDIDERTLKKCSLSDVSIVTYPAYLDTVAAVSSGRDMRDAAKERARAKEQADRIRSNNFDIRRRKLALREKEF